MQSIDGGVGRLFGRGGGGGGGGERRLKPHHHQGFGGDHGCQALKCPRCDSLNTKFCYYNNYNLSQPRFFCKGCRRYWTKGGVLRNVPVGGGCRKTKRSKQNSGNDNPPSKRKSSDSQNSSSESSSLTANTSPATTTKTTPTPFRLTEAPPTLFSFQESSTKLYVPQSATPYQSFIPPVLDKCATDNHHMFSEMGPFKSLLTSSSEQLPLRFNPASEISTFLQQHEEQVVVKQNSNRQQWMPAMNETGEVQYSRTSNGGVPAEDWEGGAEEGLFDQSYWSQIQWNNHDHHLNYFP